MKDFFWSVLGLIISIVGIAVIFACFVGVIGSIGATVEEHNLAFLLGVPVCLFIGACAAVGVARLWDWWW